MFVTKSFGWQSQSGMAGAFKTVSPLMESTRIIPFTGSRPTLPTHPARPDPDPTLIRLEIVNGRDQLSGGDAENGPRFAGEVHYIRYYADRLAETLGMRRLEACILEDRDGQTSIAATAQSSSWIGSIQTTRRSIKQVLESLGK